MTTASLHRSRAVRTRWLVSDSLALARRNLEHVRQIPEKLLDVTLQPIMFVLLFAFVFGGVIAVPGGDYHDYLIGGILVQSLAFGMMGPGVSIATDLGEGIVDRVPLAADVAVGVPARPLRSPSWRRRWSPSSSSRSPASRSAGASTPACRDAIGGFALLVAVRGGDDLARHADRRHRPLARRRAGHRVHDRVPADVPVQRVRAGRGPAGRAAADRRVEPDQRGRRRRCARCSATRPRSRPTRRGRSQHPVLAAVLWSVAFLAVAAPLCVGAVPAADDGLVPR